MASNQNPAKEGDSNKVSTRVSGMPTIAELRRRVMMRKLKKEKSGTNKKHRSN